MKTEVVPALAWHADAIAATARKADIDELWAQARVTPLVAMRHGMRLTIGTRTGLVDGVPACMFGVMSFSILQGHGVPWMVGSTVLEPLSVQKALLLHSRVEFERMRNRYALLFNVVDDRNTAAKRWLRWLGFKLDDPIPYGPDGLPFRPFQWSK